MLLCCITRSDEGFHFASQLLIVTKPDGFAPPFPEGVERTILGFILLTLRVHVTCPRLTSAADCSSRSSLLRLSGAATLSLGILLLVRDLPSKHILAHLCPRLHAKSAVWSSCHELRVCCSHAGITPVDARRRLVSMHCWHAREGAHVRTRNNAWSAGLDSRSSIKRESWHGSWKWAHCRRRSVEFKAVVRFPSSQPTPQA
mmetsp:Transcript_13160/g.24269  ORF Transcript_13160/g.24269 Transcript_13160/m.24269 type:complete len:201 (+) Transcript_13160:863-1465(+)